MHFPPKTLSRATAMTAGALSLILALAACTPASDRRADMSSTPQAATGLPSAHVHGLSVSADTGQVLLATHDGLFDMTQKSASKIGGTNDLMGFTGAKDHGVYYASGHPGPGSNLPNPLGLIRTADGGKTWEQLSRQGKSDFHALTTTKSGIVAFDGELRTTVDGKTWKTIAAAIAPTVLAGHPDSDTVLATTPQGIRRSTDGGHTWEPVLAGPVIQFAAFADPGEVAGVEPGGTVHYSPDAGATWTRKGKIDGEVQAIASVKGVDGTPWIFAATTHGIVVSTDGGTTFRASDAS